MNRKSNLPLLLLAGKSGAGKDTVARLVCRDLHLSQVASYTTRAMRLGEVNGVGHYFISDEEYDRIPKEEIIASTVFAGHRYCATVSQLDDAGVYIVDKKGIEDVRKNYHSPFYVVYLYTDDDVRRLRMKKRGDAPYEIEARIRNDRKAFDGIDSLCDVVMDANNGFSPNDIAKAIEEFLQSAGRTWDLWH